MKKLSQLLLIASFVLVSLSSFAQGDTKKDENRIMLTA